MKLEDFITKPISSEKILKALQQSHRRLRERRAVVDAARHIVYSYSRKTIMTEGSEVSLTNMEIELIELLVKECNRVVSYEQIENVVYEGRMVNRSSIKNLIRRLRCKVDGLMLRNIPDVGYMLECRQ